MNNKPAATTHAAGFLFPQTQSRHLPRLHTQAHSALVTRHSKQLVEFAQDAAHCATQLCRSHPSVS